MPLAQIAARYLAVAAETWPLALAMAALLLLVQHPAAQARLAGLSRRARQTLLALVIAGGLVWAAALAWVCDDAFISFRYAAHWAHGQGLVWNLSERVEGFTNFLWTALLAAAIRVGLDPVQSSVVLGLAAFAGTLVAVARLVAAVRPAGDPWRFPLAVVALAASYTFASFGTSGLETMLATGLTVLAVERALAGSPLASGACGIAATMCHPDHALFYVGLGLALLLERPPRRTLLRYAAPFLVVYLPYFLLRWRYYGHPFPNTYYAKEGAGTYWSQGLVYLWASFLGAGLWALLPLAVYGWWRTRGTLFARACALTILPYLGYVAKIGGDYMSGRLVVVVLPPIFILAEIGAAGLPRPDGRLARRFATLLPILTLPAMLPTPVIPPHTVTWRMSDERTLTGLASFSPPVVDSLMFDRALVFRRRLVERRIPVRLADIQIGMLGYYNDVDVIDCHGLTDQEVARLPLPRRGRPGHEKMAPPEYLQRRAVDLSRMPVFRHRYTGLTELAMPDHVSYFLGRWRPDLIAAFSDIPGFAAHDVPAFLDRYLAGIDDLPAARVAEDLTGFFDPFYFAANPDPARRERFLRRLGVAAGTVSSP
jgi:hypothetical protein